MSCRDYERYIQLYVDQEINEEDRRKLLEHTRSCPDCRRELKEMVALVSSMEDARQEMRTGTPLLFRGFFKWVAVCTVAVSFAYLAIPFTQKSGSENPAQPMQHSLMVLAGQEESLHIPQDESVHVVHPGRWSDEGFTSEATLVYPSAVSFFLEKERSWSEYTKRFVFIRVPDEQTLVTLLTYAGAKVEQLTGLANIQYPTSVMITLEESPEYETFTFPEEETDVSALFERISSTPMISEPATQH
mgnify:CR=1 FL=1